MFDVVFKLYNSNNDNINYNYEMINLKISCVYFIICKNLINYDCIVKVCHIESGH